MMNTRRMQGSLEITLIAVSMSNDPDIRQAIKYNYASDLKLNLLSKKFIKHT